MTEENPIEPASPQAKKPQAAPRPKRRRVVHSDYVGSARDSGEGDALNEQAPGIYRRYNADES
jgi:hypothetical protein